MGGVDSTENKHERSSMEQSKQRKFVVLGFSAVGKSAITNQFVHDHFPDYYNPTIEATFQKVVRYKGKDIEILIRDTAGQDEYTIFHHRYCVGVHGYILLYSVDSKQSFEMVKVINEKLLNLIGTDRVPRVLVGNKMDLEYERKVSTDEARILADSWGCPFVECSAKLNQNVGKVFSLLLSEIEKEQQEDTLTENRCRAFVNFFKHRRLSLFHRRFLTYVLKVLSVLTLLSGVGCTVIGAMVGIGSDSGPDSSWLSYAVLGCGLFTVIVSVVGFYGFLKANKELTNVYFYAISAILIAHLTVALILLIQGCQDSCHWFTQHTVPIAIFSAFSLLFEVSAIAVSMVLRCPTEEDSAYQLIP
uniref:Rheb1 n=1 Tax=Colponema sp. TaxID=2152668 RepID=A0A2R4IKX0_9ALVE|nr:Rheb1 [Colponema sp.]